MEIKPVKQLLINIIGKLAALLIESGECRCVLMVAEKFHEFMVNRGGFHRNLEMDEILEAKFLFSGKIDAGMFRKVDPY